MYYILITHVFKQKIDIHKININTTLMDDIHYNYTYKII